MFSKALFKQSMKANWVKWVMVTVSTCVMLAIVIIVLGNLGISDIRDSLKSVFNQANQESVLKENAVDSYDLYLTSVELQHNLKGLENGNITLSDLGQDEDEFKALWAIMTDNYTASINNFISENGREPLEEEKSAIRVALADELYQNFSGMGKLPEGVSEYLIKQSFIAFFKAYDGHDINFDGTTQEFFTEANPVILQAYYNINYFVAFDRAMEKYNDVDFATFSAGSVTALVQTAVSSYQGEGELAGYDKLSYQNDATTYVNNLMYTTARMQAPIEYSEAEKDMYAVSVKVISNSAISTYQLWLDEGKTSAEARYEAIKSITDQVPEKVATALSELGNMDMYGLIIGSMFYKIAGLLLPMVFVITTANGLLAGQVDSGSMAYVLSTPTKRRTVTVTQMTYLIVSLFAMFALLTCVSVVSIWIVGGNSFAINFGEILLCNLGAFLTMFAIAGFCFMCSAIFNRSKYSIGVGGGLTLFSLVCTILGLFGSAIMPSAMRISAMNFFNYLSIISLFDTVSILGGTLGYLWKLGILLAVGVVTFIIGIFSFDKKDLPL